LSCDSDAPRIGSARSDETSVVKVNRRKTNRRKTRPYCTADSVTHTLAFIKYTPNGTVLKFAYRFSELTN